MHDEIHTPECQCARLCMPAIKLAQESDRVLRRQDVLNAAHANLVKWFGDKNFHTDDVMKVGLFLSGEFEDNPPEIALDMVEEDED